MGKKHKPEPKGMKRPVQDAMRESKKSKLWSPPKPDVPPRSSKDRDLMSLFLDEYMTMPVVWGYDLAVDSPPRSRGFLGDYSRPTITIADICTDDAIRLAAVTEEYNSMYHYLYMVCDWDRADAHEEAKKQALEAFSPPKRKAKAHV